jgi:tRNA (cytidine/uridine-2'-O-)-methyltransferase
MNDPLEPPSREHAPNQAPPRLHIVLLQPQIAANTGAIGRTCVALRAKLWLIRPLGFHISDRRLRRAGLDYWRHLDLELLDSLDELIARRQQRRRWFFSTRAIRSFHDVRYESGDALIFGPESRGLPAHVLSDHADQAVKIPIHAHARSLNLACAVSVAAYEATRQIGFDTLHGLS